MTYIVSWGTVGHHQREYKRLSAARAYVVSVIAKHPRAAIRLLETGDGMAPTRIAIDSEILRGQQLHDGALLRKRARA